jgi:hypothetical protein
MDAWELRETSIDDGRHLYGRRSEQVQLRSGAPQTDATFQAQADLPEHRHGSGIPGRRDGDDPLEFQRIPGMSEDAGGGF